MVQRPFQGWREKPAIVVETGNSLLFALGMKVRCSYCEHIFEPEQRGRRASARQCPQCGRALLMPGFFTGSRTDASRATAGRPGAPWRPRPAGLSSMFGRPLRLIVIVAGLLFVGILLLRQARVGPPVTEAHNLEVARLNLDTLCTALGELHAHCGRYPTTEEGLVSLVHDPGLEGWRGPYVFELKPDPWGRAFHYERAAGQAILSSAGPDGQPGSADDISVEANQDKLRRPPDGVFPASLRPPDGVKE